MEYKLEPRLARALQAKRLVFCISAGRSGTQYLSEMLGYIPGSVSYHEPEPKFSHWMRTVQNARSAAFDFWINTKLPAIAAESAPIYIETSHLFGKGFFEPLLSLGIRPDLIILKRGLREVAWSLYQLGCVPERTSDGNRFLLSPLDPGVLHLPSWEHLHDYQLCYWYALETWRRMRTYKLQAIEANMRVFETSVDEISSPKGMERLLAALELPRPDENAWAGYLRAHGNKVNTKAEFKKTMPLPDFSTLEAEVLGLTGVEDYGYIPACADYTSGSIDATPLISTVLLNWNRADLLRRTLTSYVETQSVPHELIIVDNASEDRSREVIKDFLHKLPMAKAVLLQENIGGEALNVGIRQCRGRIVHLSENDLEYYPGWVETALELFGSFPSLGQLSLFSPVPEDAEVWELHPSVLRHSRGRYLYEAIHNVGTSSLVRRDIFEKGVRVRNISTETGSFLFPDDGALSSDIRALGYMVAWSPRYLASNIGHTLEEFTNRIEYYQDNYRSKYWLGIEGWKRRIEAHRRLAPSRTSFLLPFCKLMPEKTVPSSECPNPQSWSMIDGWTAEVEVLEFLYALVRLTKPSYAIETGTWHGYAAMSIGKALRDNGHGRLATIELDPHSCAIARERLRSEGLEEVVSLFNQSSLTIEPECAIDFLLLDSDVGIRSAEFRRYLPKLTKEAIVLFHDTSETHGVVKDDILKLVGEGCLEGLFLKSPRGIWIGKLRS